MSIVGQSIRKELNKSIRENFKQLKELVWIETLPAEIKDPDLETVRIYGMTSCSISIWFPLDKVLMNHIEKVMKDDGWQVISEATTTIDFHKMVAGHIRYVYPF